MDDEYNFLETTYQKLLGTGPGCRKISRLKLVPPHIFCRKFNLSGICQSVENSVRPRIPPSRACSQYFGHSLYKWGKMWICQQQQQRQQQAKHLAILWSVSRRAFVKYAYQRFIISFIRKYFSDKIFDGVIRIFTFPITYPKKVIRTFTFPISYPKKRYPSVRMLSECYVRQSQHTRVQ